MSAHENLEHAEHAEHAAHSNKKIALLIAVLALFLAFSETLGKSAQTAAITFNVTSNDLWAFFQAKTIRMTVLRTAAEQMQIEADRATDAGRQGAAAQDDRRLEEDRRPLRRRAVKRTKAASSSPSAPRKPSTARRALGALSQYEFASAAFQIGIVLASAESSPAWSRWRGFRRCSACGPRLHRASACGRRTPWICSDARCLTDGEV